MIAPTTDPAPEPIQADESEVALVSCVLQGPEAFAIAAALVEPEHFRSTQLASIWQAMAAVHETGALPDVHLVVEELDRTGAILTAGGRDRILDLIDHAHVPANAEHYARKIRDAAGSRRLAHVAAEIAQRAKDGETPATLAAAWDAAIREIQVGGEDRTQSIEQALTEIFREIDSPVSGAYVTTGFPALDERIIGWEGGQLILIGARPSMGKTALALNFAANAAQAGHGVAFFSLEMTTRDLMRRLLSFSTGISYTRLRSRGWIPAEEEWDALDRARAWMRQLPLWIDETAAITLGTLRLKMRRLVDRGVRVFFVDYLGLVMPPKGKTISNRENEIGVISRTLKRYAKEFDVAIIALQQLNRDKARGNESAKDNADKVIRPGLTDLRDSGSLEQDADAVIFLHRDAYYTKDPHDHRATVIIAKQRNGEVCDVTLAWSGENQRFHSIEADNARRVD